MNSFFGGFLTTAVVLGIAFTSGADQVTFSGELSDMDQPNLDVFAATIDYTFDASTNVLTMQVFNQTVSPNGYTLSELYFNVSNDVTGLTVLNNGGFTGAALTKNKKAGPFGAFDFFFDFQAKGGKGVGANYGLAANSSVILTFQVTGNNLDIDDFFYGYSTGGGADKGDALACIKFTQGPGDDSVFAIQLDTYGNNVAPEPTSMVLFGLGIAGFLARKRRTS